MNIKEALQRFEEYIEDSSLTKLDKPDGQGDYIYTSLKTTFNDSDFEIIPAMEKIVEGVSASAGGCYYRLHVDDHNGVIIFTASRANVGVENGKFVTFEDGSMDLEPTDLEPTDLEDGSMGNPINDSMDDSTNLESVIDNPVNLEDDSMDLEPMDLEPTDLEEEDDSISRRSSQ